MPRGKLQSYNVESFPVFAELTRMDYAELRGHADNSFAQEWSGVEPMSLPQLEDTCTAE